MQRTINTRAKLQRNEIKRKGKERKGKRKKEEEKDATLFIYKRDDGRTASSELAASQCKEGGGSSRSYIAERGGGAGSGRGTVVSKQTMQRIG